MLDGITPTPERGLGLRVLTFAITCYRLWYRGSLVCPRGQEGEDEEPTRVNSIISRPQPTFLPRLPFFTGAIGIVTIATVATSDIFFYVAARCPAT